MFKENYLSDITWALLLTSDLFRQIFIRFFFPELDAKDIKEIKREEGDEKEKDSRVDLWFLTKTNQLYIIEVKINDKKHHFKQYEKAYDIIPSHFGYITNYFLRKTGGYQIRLWEDLYDFLRKESDKIDDDENNLIKGYCEYIRKVCGIIKLKQPMNLQNLHSLFLLIETLKKLVNRDIEKDISISFLKVKSIDGEKNYNIGVDFKIDSKTESIEAWIGTYYNDENPKIWIGINKELFNDGLCSTKGMFFDFDNVPELGFYWFCLKSERRDEFEASISFERQNEILKNFIDEVVSFLFANTRKSHEALSTI